MSEQFENSIRKKLQEAEPSFDPAAWEQMKKKLDDADRRRPFAWWWLGGLLLVAGLGGWWWFGGTNGDAEKQNLPVAENVTGIKKPSGEMVNNTTGLNDRPVTEEQFGQTPGKENVNNSKDAAGSSPVSPVLGGSVNNPSSDKTNSQTSPSIPGSADQNSSSSPTPGNVNNPSADKTDPQISPSIPGDVNKSSADKTNSQTLPAVPGNVNNPGTDPQTPVSVNNATPLPAAVPTQTEEIEKSTPSNQKKKQKRGFDGGLFLGPDLNVTPAFKGLPVGITGGLLLRYHVNDRWYFNTGVGYAKKLYGASPKDYTSNYPPTYYAIDADCDVIDIPLNVHYTFAQGKSSSWSAMAGASSYLMLKEKYEYYYPNDVKYTRQYKNQNQHYFSVINLGVTWEKQTRSRISWGLQPYVKIPVKGVGQGKVKVYSAGLTVQAILGKKKD